MQPLEGIKILELSRVAPPSYSGMILADMGAQVIKIEQPVETNTPRTGSGWSPIGEGNRREAAFRAINRNKKSMAVNLSSKEGKQIFYKLAKWADVVLEGFRPGVLKRLNIDYETVSKLNPRIIYASLSGYGQDGPYSQLPGHDINYIACSGALGLIGEPDGRPIVPLNLLGDYGSGSMNIVAGILMAIIAREKTTRGQHVDISMTDGVISLMTHILSDYFRGTMKLKRGEYFLSGNAPCYSVYQAKDGKYIGVGCVEPWLWVNLCKAIEREDLIPYQWADGEKRIEVMASLGKLFLTKTRDEWFDLLEDKDTCVAKVYDIDEVFRDPQVCHRNMLLELEHPSEGKINQVGIAIKLSDTPGNVASFAPILGEHTQEILTDLGYDEDDIAVLRKANVVN